MSCHPCSAPDTSTSLCNFVIPAATLGLATIVMEYYWEIFRKNACATLATQISVGGATFRTMLFGFVTRDRLGYWRACKVGVRWGFSFAADLNSRRWSSVQYHAMQVLHSLRNGGLVVGLMDGEAHNSTDDRLAAYRECRHLLLGVKIG